MLKRERIEEEIKIKNTQLPKTIFGKPSWNMSFQDVFHETIVE